jgi:hypothetical protein
VLRTEPRILEAWAVGSRLWPVEGSPPHESSDIALVLDPLGHEQPIDAFTTLMAKLDAKGLGAGTGRAWLLVRREAIAAHREHATRIYWRDPTT